MARRGEVRKNIRPTVTESAGLPDLLGQAVQPSSQENLPRPLSMSSEPKSDLFLTVEPVGALKTHAKQSPPNQIGIEFSNEALEALLPRLQAAMSERNGVGWAISRSGKLEFIAPQMREFSDDIGQRFDSSEVIRRLGDGGYDGVFMVMRFPIGSRNVMSFHDSVKEMRSAAEGNVGFYMMVMDQPDLSIPDVAGFEVFRFNPAVPENELQQASDLAGRAHKEFMAGLNAHVSAIMPRYAEGLRSQARDPTVAFLREFPPLVGKFIKRKFNDDEAAKESEEYVKDLLESVIKRCDEQGKVSRYDSPPVSASLIEVGQKLFGRIFLDTGVVEELQTPVTPGFSYSLVGLSPDAKDCLAAASAMGAGLGADCREKNIILLQLGKAARKLKEKAAVLKPLAKGCIDNGIMPDGATLQSIHDMSASLVTCFDNKPMDDADYDTLVSLAVARGKAREAVWAGMETDGKALPKGGYSGELTRIIRSVYTELKSPPGFGNALKGISGQIEAATGRKAAELLADKRLMEIHEDPLVEVLSGSLASAQEALDSIILEAERNVGLIRTMSDADLRREYAKGSKASRAKFNPDGFRRKVEGELRSNKALRDEFGSLATILPSLSTVSLLNDLGGAEAIVEQTAASHWLYLRGKLEKTRMSELFPKTPQGHEAKVRVFEPINRAREVAPGVGEHARQLVKDMVCISKNPAFAGSGAAYLKSRLAEWRQAEITADMVPQLAAEKNLAAFVGAGVVEGYDALLEDKLGPELRPVFDRVYDAYWKMVRAMPPDMKPR